MQSHRLREMDQQQQRPLLQGESSVVGGSSVGIPSDSTQLWFIQDGCGMVCAFITWFLVLYADFVVTFVMLLPAKSMWYAVVNGVLFNCLAVLALASHLRTMLTDPVSQCLLCSLSVVGWEGRGGFCIKWQKDQYCILHTI